MNQNTWGAAEVRSLFRSVIVSLVKGLSIVVAAIALTLFAGTSAYAAPITHAVQSMVAPAADPNMMDFIGCPTLGWIMPLAPTFKNLTGSIGGVILLAILAVMFIAGIGLAFAGRNQGKAQDSVASMQNAAKGAGVVFIAIPLLGVVLFGIASSFCK